VRARTKLSRDQIGDEARRFGLSQHDLEELTTQTIGDEINIIVYPGNAQALRFVEHLCTLKLATKTG
jgi:hypothetical protein